MITSETLFVGDFDPPFNPSSTPVRQIHSREDTELVKDGEVVQRWDYIMQVTPDLVRPSTLAPLRHLADPLADALVAHLDLKPGQDAYTAVQQQLALDEVPEPVQAFWDDVYRYPPEGIDGRVEVEKPDGTMSDDATALEEALSRNERDGVDEKTGRKREPSLAEGQAVFWRYSGGIFTALMHFSLAGGFSAPKLTATMRETGYLTSASRDATHKRLLETTLMVLDCMTDMRIGDSTGFKSVVRVRLLHAQVRHRIALGKGRLKTYDVEENGIPINQADLLTVLGAFMIAPLWSLRRTGIKLTRFEEESYVVAWRHVGFYLGIDPTLLLEFYGSSLSACEKRFAALAFDAFPLEVPTDGYRTPTYQILHAVSERPPRSQSVGHHLELSRSVLGNGLAEQLAIPRGSKKERWSVQLDAWFSWIMIQFGRSWVRKGWDKERIQWMREVIMLVVVYNLGERRTVYAWRTPEEHAEKLKEGEGEGPGVKMGREVGLSMRRRWTWLMGEMAAAIGVVALGVAGGVWWSVRSWI